MAVSNVKLRMLYIMKILLEKTDEDHILSAADLDKLLKNYGMTADRKTIYSDIDTLREYGLDIVQTKGNHCGYYVGERIFEMPELKLLVDAVQSSKFITEKKSQELIKKLEGFCSAADAKQLSRNVFIYNRPKTGNETIYYNVDVIHQAILQDCQISYQYAEWTMDKSLKPKKNGAFYQVSPWALTWDDANYYLIAYEEQSQAIRHYRVDKMQNTSLRQEKRQGRQTFSDFDLASFAKKTFSMYGGRDEEITLICKKELIGVILDRFGKDCIMIPMGEDAFKVRVLISVSRQFFGWLAGIGSSITIAAPDSVKIEYRNYLADIIKMYT